MACLAALALAFAGEAATSTPYRGPLGGAGDAAQVSLMAQAGACKPGFVEKILNGWLDSTKNSEFESDYAALAFAELVDLVYLLRDIAEDFCV